MREALAVWCCLQPPPLGWLLAPRELGPSAYHGWAIAAQAVVGARVQEHRIRIDRLSAGGADGLGVECHPYLGPHHPGHAAQARLIRWTRRLVPAVEMAAGRGLDEPPLSAGGREPMAFPPVRQTHLAREAWWVLHSWLASDRRHHRLQETQAMTILMQEGTQQPELLALALAVEGLLQAEWQEANRERRDALVVLGRRLLWV